MENNEKETSQVEVTTVQEPGGFEKKPFRKPFGNKRDFGQKRDFRRRDEKPDFRSDLETHLISLRAVSKTRAGGRQRSFSVLMIAGNFKGLVGCGTGKSTDVSEAIKKAENKARKNLVRVVLRGTTIAHNVRSSFCGTHVIIKSVPEGTGLKAGGVARKVFAFAGIKDISCKCIGNAMSNHNVVYALMESFKKTMKISEFSSCLGKPIKDLLERSRV